MFQEADADKDGRIRSAPPCTQRPYQPHPPASEEEFLRILQRDVQKKF
jgi:hypothetical protein